MKHDLPHYDMHHAIFGSSLATGNYAVPSIDPYLLRGHGDDDDNSGEDSINACMMDTCPHSGDKRAGTSNGGIGTKKGEKPRLNMR